MLRTFVLTITFMMIAMLFHAMGLVEISSPMGPVGGVLVLSAIVFLIRVSIFLYSDTLIVHECTSQYQVTEKDALLVPVYSDNNNGFVDTPTIPCYAISFRSLDNPNDEFEKDNFTREQFESLFYGAIVQVNKKITRSGRVYHHILAGREI